MNAESAGDAGFVESCLKLLLAFSALPQSRRQQTFMEVAGFPHYENVCSNILRFYFDPSAEHGLKDLLLLAFLRMVGEDKIAIPDEVSVRREHAADSQSRIDLVVDCEAFVLGIENKIYHGETNNFDNYGREISRLGKNRKIFKALLCLKKPENQEPLKGEFVRYTYSELWQHTGNLLTRYLAEADSKWVTCLLDFMQTTTNLAGENMENKKLEQFLIENDTLIERMVKERSDFLRRLSKKLYELKLMLEQAGELKNVSNGPYIHKNEFLVLEFQFKQIFKVKLDLHISMKGWHLHLFGLNAPSIDYLEKLVVAPVLKERITGERIWNNRFLVAEWPLDAVLDEISDALRSWICALNEANITE